MLRKLSYWPTVEGSYRHCNHFFILLTTEDKSTACTSALFAQREIELRTRAFLSSYCSGIIQGILEFQMLKSRLDRHPPVDVSNPVAAFQPLGTIT